MNSSRANRSERCGVAGEWGEWGECGDGGEREAGDEDAELERQARGVSDNDNASISASADESASNELWPNSETVWIDESGE